MVSCCRWMSRVPASSCFAIALTSPGAAGGGGGGVGGGEFCGEAASYLSPLLGLSFEPVSWGIRWPARSLFSVGAGGFDLGGVEPGDTLGGDEFFLPRAMPVAAAAF